MTFSSLPDGAEEVSIWKLCHDVRLELFVGGAVSHVIAGQATFVLARVKLTDDIALAVLHVLHQSTQVSLIQEDFSSLAASIIDSDLHGSDTNFIHGKENETDISTNGKIHSVAIFPNHHEMLMFVVDVIGDCKLI